MKTPPKETVSFDPPDEEDEEEVKTEVSTIKGKTIFGKGTYVYLRTISRTRLCVKVTREEMREVRETPRTSLEDYRTRYLQSIRLRERTNFYNEC